MIAVHAPQTFLPLNIGQHDSKDGSVNVPRNPVSRVAYDHLGLNLIAPIATEQEAAKDKESLQSNGVTHILTVNGTKSFFENDFKYM